MKTKDYKIEIEKLTGVKNWKRQSKFKAYDKLNRDFIVLRKFTSNLCDSIVFVKEFDSNYLIDIVKLANIPNYDFEGIDKLISVTKVVKDTEGGYEDLDFENYEVDVLNNNTLNIWHGGDWQDPLECIYKYYDNGYFYIES